MFLYNHFAIHVLYEPHGPSKDQILIVGLEIYPTSTKLTQAGQCPSSEIDLFNVSTPISERIRVGQGSTAVTYSYSVYFNPDPAVTWGKRWDRYLAGEFGTSETIHWYSIVNSILITVLLTIMAAIILLRSLNRDIALYLEEDLEDLEDVVGWKLVHGDVFRRPGGIWILSAFYGTGIQILVTLILTVLFGLVGVINPSFRGGLVTFAIFSFAFTAAFGGYHSVRLAKSFKGLSWRRAVLSVSLPSI